MVRKYFGAFVVRIVAQEYLYLQKLNENICVLKMLNVALHVSGLSWKGKKAIRLSTTQRIFVIVNNINCTITFKASSTQSSHHLIIFFQNKSLITVWLISICMLNPMVYHRHHIILNSPSDCTPKNENKNVPCHLNYSVRELKRDIHHFCRCCFFFKCELKCTITHLILLFLTKCFFPQKIYSI